jgi:hypothetical protein
MALTIVTVLDAGVSIQLDLGTVGLVVAETSADHLALCTRRCPINQLLRKSHHH